jgi:cyclophilin family peptidyl-prolyl cis-trans isomerase
MAKKKSVKKVEAEKSDKLIQYIAIAVVLIVVVLIAWPSIKKLGAGAPAGTSPSIAAPGDLGSSTACAQFDFIPAAGQYNEAPPLKVDPTKQYFASVKMASGGEFVIQLYPDKAPITVNSFVFLACKKFFDGVTFHRVLDKFMAQGGDPTGTGTGGPGYEFVNEKSDLAFNRDGVVAMANSGPDTNGSQFFITYGAQEFLNGDYTIFGQVVEGMDVVNGLKRRDPDQSPNFEGDAIATISISEK